MSRVGSIVRLVTGPRDADKHERGGAAFGAEATRDIGFSLNPLLGGG